MSGYDGPSFFKQHESDPEKNTGYSTGKKHEALYRLPEHTYKSIFIDKNRTSTPFRLHTVPSAYFASHKRKTIKKINYSELKTNLMKKEKNFLLFEAYLSEKGEKLWQEEAQESSQSLSAHSPTQSSAAKRRKNLPGETPRKRLSRSLAGIIEAEKSNEARTKNMSSLFTGPGKL